MVIDYETTNNNARGGIENYTVFLRREILAAARRELDLMFQDEFRGLEVALRPRIEQLMIDLQSRLLRTFRENEGGAEAQGVPLLDGQGDEEGPEAAESEHTELRQQYQDHRDQELGFPERQALFGAQSTEHHAAATISADHGIPPPELNLTESDNVEP